MVDGIASVIGRVTVGRMVHLWTVEGGTELVPNPAFVLAVSKEEEDSAYLHVLWVGGFGGQDRVWAKGCRVPMEGRWTWPDLM